MSVVSGIILSDNLEERLEWAEGILRSPDKWLEYANGEEIVRTAMSVVTDNQRVAKEQSSAAVVEGPVAGETLAKPDGDTQAANSPNNREQAMATEEQRRGVRMDPSGPMVEDSFADGISGFAVGRGVLKLDLYRVQSVEQETGQEVRTHSHRLVLPLTAVQELATVVQQFQQAAAKKSTDKQV